MRGAALVALLGCGTTPGPLEPPPRASVSTPPRGDGVPLLPEGRIPALDVAVMDDSTCVLLADRSVWCVGPLYDAPHASTHTVHEMPIPKVKSLASIDTRTYALTEDGAVFEWGLDPYLRPIPAPRRLAKLDGVTELAVAPGALCYRRGGDAECDWIFGDPPHTTAPGARAISARQSETCVARDANVACMGNGTLVEHPIANVVELAASMTLTCARTNEGRVKCWRKDDRAGMDLFGDRAFVALGANPYGICAIPVRGAVACAREIVEGDGDAGRASFDEAMHARRGVTSVALGATGACFVEAGVVWCWGDADVTRESPEPRPLDLGDLTSLRASREVAIGKDHTCVVGVDDVVRCWGVSHVGALGLGGDELRIGPERLHGVGPVEHVVARDNLTCVVTKPGAGDEEGGRVLCAGGFSENEHNPDCDRRAWPCRETLTLVTTGAKDVTIGQHFACVLDRDGGVRCWGRNDLGQLGAGDTEDANAPRPVVDASGAPLARVRKVVAGRAHACAIVDAPPGEGDGGGALTCWGYDDPGVQGRALADLSPTARSARTSASPVALPSAPVDVGERCVVLEGGDLRCWGDLVNGDFATTPTRVGVCDATRVVDGCALTPRGVVCERTPPMRRASAYAGPPIASWAQGETSTCWVDEAHRVSCRALDDDVPVLGDIPLVGLTGAGCAADPPTGAGAPIAMWRRAVVQAPSGMARAMKPEEVKVIADVWAGPVTSTNTGPARCEGPGLELYFVFGDAFGETRAHLQYIGPPCESLRDGMHVEGTQRKLTKEGRALVKSVLAELGATPPPDAYK